MTTITGHTTRASGTVLTAAIYNADHTNHIANAVALNTTKLEGATPPVVDGHSVVWNGTSGALLRSSGGFPANSTRQIATGTGLTGGGDLSADRTLSVDFASQAEAEAGTSIVDVMSPLRATNHFNIRKASQAEAEGAVEDTKWMSSLRVQQNINVRIASQAEAEGGVDTYKVMTSQRVKQSININSPLTYTTSSDSALLDYPLGTVIPVFAGTAFLNLNTTIVPRRANVSPIGFTTSASATTALSGTWRVSGLIYSLVISCCVTNYTYLARRVA